MMKCPFCGKEMIDGAVKSAREIIFTRKPNKKRGRIYKNRIFNEFIRTQALQR